MKKAVIVVHSKTGITRRYAEGIEEYLTGRNIETTLLSIREYKPGSCTDADYILLGCWTSGLMVLLQHPDSDWKEFAGRFEKTNGRTILFTTYKILTGSMFKNMMRCLGSKINEPFATLKSRNGNMSEKDKEIIEKFIG